MTGPGEPEVSIVIPLYNEAGCIKRNLEQVEEHLKSTGFDYEIVLVNDGSTDDTRTIIEEILSCRMRVRLMDQPVNRGKGYAVKSGVLHARGKFIVMLDADLAVPVGFLKTCINHLKAGCPVVIGSRHLPGSSMVIREKPLRQFLGEVFRRLVRFGLHLTVSDVTCGFKGFEKSAAAEIFFRSRIERWGYDAEIIFIAQQLGYTIREMPVLWYHSFDSKVQICTDTLRTLVELFYVKYYHLRKLYGKKVTP